MAERAKILYDNLELEIAHQEAAQRGDSETPEVDEQGRHVGMHFVAFVKEGGILWELEGCELLVFLLVYSSWNSLFLHLCAS